MKIPDINPVHFYDSAAYPTATNSIYPTIANQKIGVEAQENDYAKLYQKEIPFDTYLTLIFVFTDQTEFDSKTFSIKYNNEVDPIDLTLTNITPTGWLNSIVGKIYVKIDKAAAAKFYIHDEGTMRSDDIAIIDSSYKSKLIKLRYFNSENAFGIPFNDVNDANQIDITTYFTGKLMQGDPQIELEIFEGQGYSEPLKSTIFKSYNIELYDIHRCYVPIITQILGLDKIYINGLEMVVSKSGYSVENKGKTDIVDIKFKTTLKENDYNTI